MKVYDAIMFYDELDLLEIRLHELADVVDCFVIVESLERHGNSKKKPAILRDNIHRLRGFEHKIKHVVLDKLEPRFTNEPSCYARERYQRDFLLTAAIEAGASTSDLLIIADCDEIPRASALRENLCRATQGLLHFQLEFFYYNVNTFLYSDWTAACIGTVETIRNVGGAENARRMWNQTPVIRNGGWHFSYFADVEKIRVKLESFLHSLDAETQAVLRKSNEQLAHEIRSGQNIYKGRTQPKRVEISTTLPAYLLANIEKFKHFTADVAK